jgi:hypothetical protein
VNVSAPRMRRGRFGLKSAAPILCHVSAGQLALSRRYFSSLLGVCAAERTSAATREKPVSYGKTACAQGPTLVFSVSPLDPRFSQVSL